MIPANELRIGNLVLWNPKLLHPRVTLPPIRVEVTAILPDRIGYVSPGIEFRVEPFEDDLQHLNVPYKLLGEFEPIILTHELLLNSGFTLEKKLRDNNGWYTKPLADKALKVFFEKGKLLYALDKKEILGIPSVHQLQNLYFVLTGSELDIHL